MHIIIERVLKIHIILFSSSLFTRQFGRWTPYYVLDKLGGVRIVSETDKPSKWYIWLTLRNVSMQDDFFENKYVDEEAYELVTEAYASSILIT